MSLICQEKVIKEIMRGKILIELDKYQKLAKIPLTNLVNFLPINPPIMGLSKAPGLIEFQKIIYIAFAVFFINFSPI